MSSYLSSQTWIRDLISPLTGGKDPLANLSWIGVLGALTLAALPHWYTIYLAESNKVQGGWSNVNPRFWVQQLIAKSATSKLSELELFILRGQSCQANAFENAPLFAATLIWANYTALPLATINNFVIAYLASRALYTVLYLNTTSKVNSFARTIAFNFGIVHMLSLWIRGGLNISPSLK